MEHPRAIPVSFTEEEVEFLAESRLARIATVSVDMQPHVVPVTYEFDGTSFYFSGWNLARSLKFRNIQSNNKVAMVFDDLLTVVPWRPRGLEIRGLAQIGYENGTPYVKVVPTTKRSWGL
ncbi:MAG TPA: PPOX class F420-dependent oxidoreductase [Conexivisphaerales archaeon]|nr:PPOX class F420-dependent oxidoreductase [Conexivisphaerales archaeon]